MVQAPRFARCQDDHPFWSATDQRFERSDDLTVGEQVLGADGGAITTWARGRIQARDAVYNLSVEGIHTYNVGTNEALVHNSCFTAVDALNNPSRWTV